MTALLEDIQTKLAEIDEGVAETSRQEAEKVLRSLLPGVFGYDDWDAFEKVASKTDARKFFGSDQPKPDDATDMLRGTPYAASTVEDVEFAYHILRQADAAPHMNVEQWDRERHEKIVAAINKIDDPSTLRAMDSAEAGYGLEFIGAQYVNRLWEAARESYRIANLFEFIDMTAPTTTLPTEAGLPEALFYGESTTATQAASTTTKTGTGKVTLTAKKLLFHQRWSSEVEEDTVIPWIPFLRRQLSMALSHYTDSLLLNGDLTNASTGNINLDDADPADTKHYLALDGIRHLGIVDNTANAKAIGGAITATEMLLARGRMRNATNSFEWSSDPRGLAHIVDFSTYIRLIDLDEVQTLDKLGPSATILTGQLASIFNTPVIVSPIMPLTEADGKVSTSAANNVKGQIATVARGGWIGGYRRRFRIEFDRVLNTDQSILVGSTRIAFENYDTEVADVMYNITV